MKFNKTNTKTKTKQNLKQNKTDNLSVVVLSFLCYLLRFLTLVGTFLFSLRLFLFFYFSPFFFTSVSLHSTVNFLPIDFKGSMDFNALSASFYAPSLKGPPGASSNRIVRLSVCPSVCLPVCPSVHNSIPPTNKVQYLKVWVVVQ